MFHDIENYPFLIPIKNDVDNIVKELEYAYTNNEHVKNFIDSRDPFYSSHVEWYAKDQGIHEEQIGVDIKNKGWSAFPIFKAGFPFKWYKPEAYFPTILNHIKSVPNAYFSAFGKLLPHSSMLEHKHIHNHLVFHLCLYELDADSVIICNGKTKVLRHKGDFAIFNTSLPHSSYNYSNQNRINFGIDFRI